jgi:hypothetical protein
MTRGNFWTERKVKGNLHLTTRKLSLRFHVNNNIRTELRDKSAVCRNGTKWDQLTLDLFCHGLSRSKITCPKVRAAWRTKPTLIISHVTEEKNAERSMNLLKVTALRCLIHRLVTYKSEFRVLSAVCSLHCRPKPKPSYHKYQNNNDNILRLHALFDLSYSKVFRLYSRHFFVHKNLRGKKLFQLNSANPLAVFPNGFD